MSVCVRLLCMAFWLCMGEVKMALEYTACMPGRLGRRGALCWGGGFLEALAWTRLSMCCGLVLSCRKGREAVPCMLQVALACCACCKWLSPVVRSKCKMITHALEHLLFSLLLIVVPTNYRRLPCYHNLFAFDPKLRLCLILR